MRGINEIGKRELLEDWALKNGIQILVVTETKFAFEGQLGGKPKETPEGRIKMKHYKWYFSSGIDTRKHENMKKQKLIQIFYLKIVV